MDVKPSMKFCILCCCSFDAGIGVPDTIDRFAKFIKFTQKLQNFQKKGCKLQIHWKDEKIALCNDCSYSINSTTDVMDKMNEVESRVYILQKELLEELRKLQNWMEKFTKKLKTVENTVRNSDENCLAYLVELGHGKKEDVYSLRKGVLKVRANLEPFRSTLMNKSNVQMQQASLPEDDIPLMKRIRMRSCATELLEDDIPLLERLSKNRETLDEDDVPLMKRLSKRKKSLDEAVECHQDDEQSEPEEVHFTPEDETDHYPLSDHSDGDNDEGQDDAPYQPGKDIEEKDSSSESEVMSESELQPIPKTKRMRQTRTSTLTKRAKRLHNVDISEITKPYQKMLNEMSKLKRGFVIAALRRKKRQEDLKRAREAAGEGADNEHENADMFEDYWFRDKYPMGFKPETGEISIGDGGFIVDDGLGILTCTQCSWTIPIPEQCTSHRHARNIERKTYRHILGEHLNAYLCPECGRNFKSEWGFKQHMEGHRQSELATCDICGKKLGRIESIAGHKFTHMNAEEKEEAKKNGTWKGWKRVNPDVRKYICSICGKAFKTRKDQSQHEQTHDPDSREMTVCPICGKTMLRTSYEWYHSKYACTGREIVRVPCQHCNRTFQSSRSLKTHVERTHSAEALSRAYQCSICGKDFACKSNLMTHVALHNDDAQYICQCCGKDFTVRRYWRRHETQCMAQAMSGTHTKTYRSKRKKKVKVESDLYDIHKQEQE